MAVAQDSKTERVRNLSKQLKWIVSIIDIGILKIANGTPIGRALGTPFDGDSFTFPLGQLSPFDGDLWFSKQIHQRTPPQMYSPFDGDTFPATPGMQNVGLSGMQNANMLT